MPAAGVQGKGKAKGKARGRLVIIDVGQAVERTSDSALELLARDVGNALAFLSRLGLRCARSHDVIQWIVGDGQDGVPLGEEVWAVQDELIAKAAANEGSSCRHGYHYFH